MKILFQNHSSLLIENKGKYLLTDPWVDQPAFGSWLPSFPPYIHPSYLASLENNLTILISHGHDDHFDDRLLKNIFNKDTKIITANFKAPSVLNRVKKLGFNNIETVGTDGKLINGFYISSYIVEDQSHDDAAYLIFNDDGAVIHANDNWQEFTLDNEALLIEKISKFPNTDVLLFSQTNSASGFPLTYETFSDSDQKEIHKEKVLKMIKGGLNNAKKLGLKRMFSYAGFATPYVKGEKYHEKVFFPTASFINNLLQEQKIDSLPLIEEFYPGDFITLPGGNITKAFLNGYSDSSIRKKTHEFYTSYGKIDECITYKNTQTPNDISPNWVEDFLNEFNNFSIKRFQGPDSHYTKLIGKTFRLTIKKDDKPSLIKTIKFGDGLVNEEEVANKECIVSDYLFNQILLGKALFEDLITGYNAKWKRNPSSIYNRDIIMMIVMFSYVYKNRLASTYLEKYKIKFSENI